MDDSSGKWLDGSHVAQLIVQNMPSGLFVYRLAPDGTLRLVDANPEAASLMGVEVCTRVGDDFNNIWPGAQALGITDKFIEVVKTGAPFRDERLAYSDGDTHAVSRVRAFRIHEHHVAVVFEDLTKAVEQDTALKESEERFRILAQASTEGILLTRASCIIDCNQRVQTMFGYSRDELIGMAPERLVAEESREFVAERMNSEKLYPYHFRFQGQKNDGAIFPVSARGSVSTYRGEDVRLTVIRDRSDEERTLSLEHLAMTDGLTGLFNHRYFQEALKNEVERSDRAGASFALLMVDIDHFKRVNDEHGHLEGDAVLQQLATLLNEATRRGDVVTRYGGEEFAVILPNMDARSALGFANRVRERVASTPLGEQKLDVTVTIGAAMFPNHGQTADALFAAADRALYAGKNGGRNRCEIASPASV